MVQSLAHCRPPEICNLFFLFLKHKQFPKRSVTAKVQRGVSTPTLAPTCPLTPVGA